jgi:hypothetical protein
MTRHRPVMLSAYPRRFMSRVKTSFALTRYADVALISHETFDWPKCMRTILIAFLAFLLVVFVAGGVAALLPACGLIAPLSGRIGVCAEPEADATRQRLSALADRHAELSGQVAALERRVGGLRCEREVAAPAIAPPAEPQITPPAEPAIDAEAWNDEDISLLEGCWMLDSSFQTTDVVSGAITDYTSWRMCFDRGGSGEEELRSDSGATCAGKVTASFDGSGTLVIEEPGNLRCGDGAQIYRMISRCALKDDGTARCEIKQPELNPNRGGSASFRRAPRSD